MSTLVFTDTLHGLGEYILISLDCSFTSNCEVDVSSSFNFALTASTVQLLAESIFCFTLSFAIRSYAVSYIAFKTVSSLASGVKFLSMLIGYSLRENLASFHLDEIESHSTLRLDATLFQQVVIGIESMFSVVQTLLKSVWSEPKTMLFPPLLLF